MKVHNYRKGKKLSKRNSIENLTVYIDIKTCCFVENDRFDLKYLDLNYGDRRERILFSKLN